MSRAALSRGTAPYTWGRYCAGPINRSHCRPLDPTAQISMAMERDHPLEGDGKSRPRGSASYRPRDPKKLIEHPEHARLIADAQRAIARAREVVAPSSSMPRLAADVAHDSVDARRWSDRLSADAAAIRADVLGAVRALARAQRSAGVSPEETVVLLKHIIAKAKVSLLERDLARSLEEDVVSCGIEAYYAAD